MARLKHPPPGRQPPGLRKAIPVGTELRRIYNPRTYKDGTQFRWEGPFARFDHHATGSTDRGIWYGAERFGTCVVEVFGDEKIIDLARNICVVAPKRELCLVDLRKGAMSNATFAAIGSVDDYELPQEWSRYYYDNYDDIDGLYYNSFHNGEPAIALYDRAASTLRSVTEISLADSSLTGILEAIAIEYDLLYPR